MLSDGKADRPFKSTVLWKAGISYSLAKNDNKDAWQSHLKDTNLISRKFRGDFHYSPILSWNFCCSSGTFHWESMARVYLLNCLRLDAVKTPEECSWVLTNCHNIALPSLPAAQDPNKQSNGETNNKTPVSGGYLTASGGLRITPRIVRKKNRERQWD